MKGNGRAQEDSNGRSYRTTDENVALALEGRQIFSLESLAR
jgi:hypothetical protein